MKRVIELAVAVISAILLAGCYESNALLLDVSAARQPISSYQDWNYTTEGTTYHARLNPRSDGWYDYQKAMIGEDGTEGEWEHYTVLLNYLENAAGMDVYIVTYRDDMEEAYVYGLVAFEPNGAWQSLFPACDFMADERYLEIDSNAAEAAGAELYSDEFTDICIFNNTSSLFSAMRTIVRDSGFRARVEEAKK